MKGTELIVAEKLNAEVLFTKEGELDKVMEMIRSKVAEFEPDLETAAGRKEIASLSRKVSSSKAFLDGIRKAQNAKAKAEIDGRNGLWKPAREELDELRDTTRQPLTDYEAEEKRLDEERIAGVQEDIAWMKNFVADPFTQDVDRIKQIIGQIEAFEITPEKYFEFTSEANKVKQDGLIAASLALETRERMDKDNAERKAEVERQAKVKAEQDRIAAEQKAAQDKLDEDNAKLQAQKDALEAEKKAEQERKDREEFERGAKIKAEADAKEKAEQAKKNRIAKEEAEAAEKERQEALKPDKEKLEGFSQWLTEEITYPEVASDVANGIIARIRLKIQNVAADLHNQAQSM